jgi:O-antigen ligase
MPQFSDDHKNRLIVVAGILYTLSLHKYISRDALSTRTGMQGPLEFALISAALACAFLATHHERRRYPASPVILCFAVYGLFALASSWRSFNPPLSIAKGLLLFGVLAIGYLVSQGGLAIRFFQTVYWSYTASLAFGLTLALALPARFPLWTVDDFTGRARLSVYSTFPGTMGETAAYLILLSPIIFRRSHLLSRVFLLLMNFATGGKTSTAVLLLLLALEYLLRLRTSRSWRFVGLVAIVCLAVPVTIWLTLYSQTAPRLLDRATDMVYGHDVSAEAMSLDGRLALWESSTTLILGNPLLGYGFDGARETLIKVAEWSGSSHNGFLELGLTAGMSGLGIFLVGLGGVLRSCCMVQPDLRRRALLVLGYMLSIACTGITFNFPSYFGLLILIFLLYWGQTRLRGLTHVPDAKWPTPLLLPSREVHSCRV